MTFGAGRRRRLLPALASALLAAAAGLEGRPGRRAAEVHADGTTETKALEHDPDGTTSLERPSRSGALLRREAGTALPPTAWLNLKDPAQVDPDSTEPDFAAPDPLEQDAAGIDPVEKDFAALDRPRGTPDSLDLRGASEDDADTGLPDPNLAAQHRSADRANKARHKHVPRRLRMFFRGAGRGGRHRKQRHRSPLQKAHGEWWTSPTKASNRAPDNNVPRNIVENNRVAIKSTSGRSKGGEASKRGKGGKASKRGKGGKAIKRGKASKRGKGGKASKRGKGGKASKEGKGGKASKGGKGGKASKGGKGGKASKGGKGGKASKGGTGGKASKGGKGGKASKGGKGGKAGKGGTGGKAGKGGEAGTRLWRLRRSLSRAEPSGAAPPELGASFVEEVDAESGPGETDPPPPVMPAATPLPPVVTAAPAPVQAASTTVPWEGELDKEVEEEAAAKAHEAAKRALEQHQRALEHYKDHHEKLKEWAKDHHENMKEWAKATIAKAKAEAASAKAEAEEAEVHTPPLTTQQSAGKELFDCSEAFNEWKFGWSTAKQEWCCRYKHRGCHPQEATPHPPEAHTVAESAGAGGEGPDGKDVCEGQGWSQHACTSLGCCVYDIASSICYSAVADQPCSIIHKVPKKVRDRLQQRLHEGPHKDDEGRLDEVLKLKHEKHLDDEHAHEDVIDEAIERHLREHDEKQRFERRHLQELEEGVHRHLEAQEEGVHRQVEEEIHRATDHLHPLHAADDQHVHHLPYGHGAAGSVAPAPGQPGIIVVHSPTEEPAPPSPPAPPPAAQPIIVVPPEPEAPVEAAPQPAPQPIIVVPPQHEEPAPAPAPAPPPPPIFVIPQHHPSLAAPAPQPPQPPIIIEPGATPGAPMQVVSGPTDAPAALFGAGPSPSAPPADGKEE